jgi:adenylate cyclase
VGRGALFFNSPVAVYSPPALESVPNDGPSMTFIKRIDSLIKTPPGEDWDGSWRLA